jgi:FMN-dependent dehydrogenase
VSGARPTFGDYQLEIYLAGLSGVLPSFPMAFAELEARASRALPPSVLSYVAGGAVGVGRPYAYGLALGGADGIVHVLRSILAEADLIMAVDGYPALAA